MNIDREKVEQKLLFMQENLNKLRTFKDLDKDEFVKDFRNVDSAKYLLQVSIEAMLDIASEIIARNSWGKAEDNKPYFEILAENKVIDKDDVNAYFNMAKFRNRNVSMYFCADDKRVYEITQNNIEYLDKYIKNIVQAIKAE